MGLNPFPKHRLPVRLTVQELHSRTVPALLAGMEGEFVSDTEEVFIADELALADPSIAESGFAEFSITSFDESAPDDLVAEGEILDDVPVFKGEGTDDFVIMPYYRTLTATGDEETPPEVVDATLDPDAIFWTFGGIAEGEVASEEYVGEELFDPDAIFWTFGMADGEVVCDIPTNEALPEEVMYFSMGAPEEVPLDDVVTFDETVVLDDVILEEPTEVVDPIPEEWLSFTMTSGAGEEVLAEEPSEETKYDPAVCYMVEDKVAPVTKSEIVSDDSDDSISIFTLDDFVSDDATAETEDVEVTTEVVTEPEAVTPTPTPLEAKHETKPILTDYFSLDGDMLDFYFGSKKKK